MPRAKRGPSLFEVIRSASPPSEGKRLAVPRWWGSNDPDHQPQGDETQPTPPALVDGSERRPQSELRTPPLVAVDGPKLVLSFTSSSAGVTAFILMALIAGVYLIGRASGLSAGRDQGYALARESIQAKALNDIDAARQARPKADIFANLPSSPVKANLPQAVTAKPPPAVSPKPTQQAGQPAWVRGHTYIVVQEFLGGDLPDADKARQFLRENGVATTIFPTESSSKYKYRLVTQRGFNCDDPVQKNRCNEYHERIRKLGDLFVDAGGRYNLQGYLKKATAHRDRRR